LISIKRNLIMENAYIKDILGQAAVLPSSIQSMSAACRDGALPAWLAGRSFDRYVLTGMGSSFWALHPLYLRLLNAGRAAWLVETSELLYNSPALLDGERTLVVAASQSGASAEIVRLVERCEKGCNLVGLVNEAGSPLSKRASAALLLGVGAEATVSCKTYTACLAAQSLLGDLLLGQAPDSHALLQAARAISAYLENWQAHVAALKTELKGIRQLYMVGRGNSLASAGTAGLTTKESTHIPAEGMSSAAFRHGPFEMIGPDTFLLVFNGDVPTQLLNRRLYEEVVALGGRSALLQPGSGQGAWFIGAVPPETLPMVEILPVQMMTLALGELHDHQPGVFSHSSKITSTE
jgi:glutamine---fructose-6-phosphate transaminase (isomerizing)